MSEVRNIVILGASFAGLSAAHYIARHTLPQLQRSKGPAYKLHIIDSSTHFWWHIAAPREIVSVKEMSHSRCFVPIMDGFQQYTQVKDSIQFHHATATALDPAARNVTIVPHNSELIEKISYYALIIATGVRSSTAATTLQGDYTISQKALEIFNEKLASAKEVVIGGGGPVGVEIAGEIGSHMKAKAKITLVTSGSKLLPVLRKSLSDKAEKQLEKVGVTVLYRTKVIGSEQSIDGKVLVQLDDHKPILADVYIPAVGVTPNTEFIPNELRSKRNHVRTNQATLRVDDAGPRVYAIGDVAGVDEGGLLNMDNALPIFNASLDEDLLPEAITSAVKKKRTYKPKGGETQIVPVGAKTGVGAFNGLRLPSFAIAKIKGKDYMISRMDDVTQGNKWKNA